MNISAQNPLPLYYQLREQLREKILAGEWTYGQELPSETKLCNEYHLSRATVKQAFDGLVADGMIVRRQGRGTFVNYKKVTYSILEEPNLYYQLEQEGASQTALVLEQGRVPASQELAKLLEIPSGSSLCHFKRIRKIDGIPMLIQNVFIPEEFEKGLLSQDLTAISFHRYLEEQNQFRLDEFHINIEAVILGAEDSALLDIDQPTAGFFFKTIFQNQDRKVMYNERVFRGDMINLSLNFDYNGNQTEKELRIFHSIENQN